MIKRIVRKLEKGVGLDVDSIKLSFSEAAFLLKYLKEVEKERKELREKEKRGITSNE